MGGQDGKEEMYSETEAVAFWGLGFIEFRVLGFSVLGCGVGFQLVWVEGSGFRNVGFRAQRSGCAHIPTTKDGMMGCNIEK